MYQSFLHIQNLVGVLAADLTRLLFTSLLFSHLAGYVRHQLPLVTLRSEQTKVWSGNIAVNAPNPRKTPMAEVVDQDTDEH